MERDMKIEKLKYQDNKISYNLSLITFLVNQVYLIVIMNNVKVDYHVGIEIFINLIFYMFLFLGMEKVKAHHVNWSKFFIILSGFFLLRIMYMPRKILIQVADLKLKGDELSLVVADSLQQAATIATISLVVAAVLIAISGIYGLKLSVTLKNYYSKIESVGGNTNG